VVDATVEVGVGALEGGVGIDWHGSGIDQCSRGSVWPSSSWALSQTATIRSLS
jgi:hypothetical protein